MKYSTSNEMAPALQLIMDAPVSLAEKIESGFRLFEQIRADNKISSTKREWSEAILAYTQVLYNKLCAEKENAEKKSRI